MRSYRIAQIQQAPSRHHEDGCWGLCFSGCDPRAGVGALHAGAELLGTLALGLALDGSSEGVGHAKVEGEYIILVVCVHLGVRCRDVHTEIIAEEIVRIKSKAKLPLEERVG